MITEKEQVEIGERWFKSQGYVTHKEVPVFSSSLDLLISKGETLHGIEFKLNNWEKVIHQAEKHSIALDYVSVFLNKPKRQETLDRIKIECNSKGLGLFLLEDNQNVIVASQPRHNEIWLIENEKVKEYLKMKR